MSAKGPKSAPQEVLANASAKPNSLVNAYLVLFNVLSACAWAYTLFLTVQHLLYQSLPVRTWYPTWYRSFYQSVYVSSLCWTHASILSYLLSIFFCARFACCSSLFLGSWLNVVAACGKWSKFPSRLHRLLLSWRWCTLFWDWSVLASSPWRCR